MAAAAADGIVVTSAEFIGGEAAFKTRYQRNNKRGGLKNLRCFPNCSGRPSKAGHGSDGAVNKPVHVARGFCGSSVGVAVTVERLVASQAMLISAFAEFTPAHSTHRFPVGSLIDFKSEIQGLVRSPENPLLPLIEADLVMAGAGSVAAGASSEKWVVEFNKKRKGWHYGWAANKHSCNTAHCLRVYLMTSSDDGSMKCKAILESPSFVLYCRRRRRFGNADETGKIVASPTARLSESPSSTMTEPMINVESLVGITRVKRARNMACELSGLEHVGAPQSKMQALLSLSALCGAAQSFVNNPQDPGAPAPGVSSIASLLGLPSGLKPELDVSRRKETPFTFLGRASRAESDAEETKVHGVKAEVVGHADIVQALLGSQSNTNQVSNCMVDNKNGSESGIATPSSNATEAEAGDMAMCLVDFAKSAASLQAALDAASKPTAAC